SFGPSVTLGRAGHRLKLCNLLGAPPLTRGDVRCDISREPVAGVHVRMHVRTFLATVVLTAASVDVLAQSVVCEMVKAGDTASAVSRRLTGRADSHDQPWFRVFDRSRSRVISRAGYNTLQPGWQACVPAA